MAASSSRGHRVRRPAGGPTSCRPGATSTRSTAARCRPRPPDFVADARTKYIAVAYAGTLGTSAEAIETYWTQLPTTLGLLERALERSTNPAVGWFIGDELTFADVATFDYLDALERLRPGCLDGHAGLQAFVAKFRALPSIAPFIAERTRP
jgi:glutathione S-transferase